MFAPTPQPTPPESLAAETPPSLADIVRAETDDGRLIVRFLLNLMQGHLENAKPCHRLDAARQLLNLGFSPAQSFITTNTPNRHSGASRNPNPLIPSPSQNNRRSRAGGNPAMAANHHSPETGNLAMNTNRCSRAGGNLDTGQTPNPSNNPLILSPSKDNPHQTLAELILEETDHGRAAVRFLVDVMQGNLASFKPHHRLSAAKELLRRGFDTPAPAPEVEAAPEPANSSPAPAANAGPVRPARVPGQPVRYAAPRNGNRFLEEYGPFHFESYDEEDFQTDCFGDYALRHILGSEAVHKIATLAVHDYRDRRDRLRQEARDYGPTGELAPEDAAVPADAPLPAAIYGYPALLYCYNGEGAARAAAHAAYQYFHHLRTLNSPSANHPDYPAHPEPVEGRGQKTVVPAPAGTPPGAETVAPPHPDPVEGEGQDGNDNRRSREGGNPAGNASRPPRAPPPGPARIRLGNPVIDSLNPTPAFPL